MDGKFLERLHYGIEHWPVQVESIKGIFYQMFWWDTGVKVTSSVFRFESCRVSLCLHHFNIYHAYPDLLAINKKIANEPPYLISKRNNKGNKHYQS